MTNSGHSATQFLSPAHLQQFTAGLIGLPTEELRKAKILYLRNAVSEYRMLRSSYQAFGCLQICFAIIPFFWPILWMQRQSMNAALRLYEERIRNAIAIWRDELGYESVEIENQLNELSIGK